MGVAILGVMPVSVAIVNDYEVVVRGLAGMFGHYTDRVRVVELVANRPVGEPVDIALYDTFAQGQADAKRVTQLIADHDVRQVAVYTWNFSPAMARTALRSGASGYLSKSLSARDLVECLEAIHAGAQVVRPAPRTASLVGGQWPGREEGLTARESEMLCLITQGLSNEAISERAGLSKNSVKSYIRGAYQKIQVTSRSQAVLWGVRHGLQPDSMRVPVSRDSDTA